MFLSTPSLFSNPLASRQPRLRKRATSWRERPTSAGRPRPPNTEQARRVSIAAKDDSAAETERREVQATATASLDAEQARRISELAIEDKTAGEERTVNQGVALKMMDAEQQEGVSEQKPNVRRKGLASAAGVLEELTDEVSCSREKKKNKKPGRQQSRFGDLSSLLGFSSLFFCPLFLSIP